MSQEKLTLSQRYDLAQNELQQLGNIIARVEERVDIFTKNNNSLNEKLSDHIEFCPMKQEMQKVLQRIATLEAHGPPALKQELEKDMEGVSSEMEGLYEELTAIKDKQQKLELSFQGMEMHSRSHDGFWKIVGNFAFQAITSLMWVLIAIALYHFGIPAPPTKP